MRNKNIIILFLFVFITPLFAVQDYIIKPDYNVLYKITTSDNVYPEELNQTINNDDKNIFFYKGHFRVIVGIDYNNSSLVKYLANNILNISDNVWQKEIVDFGFKPPRNSDKYYIDIYIGNKDAYNPEIGYVNISSSYCGYATAYFDKTPYFVINPDIDLNILKVTIAHEFFHTVQYAYGLDEVNDTLWNKNRWFLEASAVMMEDEIYNDVNDYINYLPDYLNNTNYPLDYANGDIEYGKVLFAKYIVEKYGIDKIKQIFEDYETNETVLEDLKKEFNFNNLMLGYAKCLTNEKSCFKEGNFYPDIKYFSQNDIGRIYQYGIAFVDEGNNTYLASSNNEYLQEDFNGSLNRKININKNGLILINKQQDVLPVNFSQNNNYSVLKIKKGWNLISNIFNDDLNLSELNGMIFWVYRNGRYKAYSNSDYIKKAIKNNNLEMNDNFILKNEGFWIYSKKDFNLTFDNINLADNNISLKHGWYMIGFSSAFKPKYIKAKIIWGYDKNWSCYSSSNELNFSEINYFKPAYGYFIFK